MNDFIIIVIMVAWCCFVIVIIHFGLRYVYNYRILQDRIAILLFGMIPVRSIYFKDILSIETGSNSEIIRNHLFKLLFCTERWGNRLLYRKAVFIKKRGLVRFVILTPNDPDEFLSTVQRLL